MVIKQQVYTLRFNLTANVYVVDKEFDDDRHGPDSDGHVEQVEFYITIQQLAEYLNKDFPTYEIAYQVTYLQAVYDSWNVEAYDTLFEDEDFLQYMYDMYGYNQSYGGGK